MDQEAGNSGPRQRHDQPRRPNPRWQRPNYSRGRGRFRPQPHHESGLASQNDHNQPEGEHSLAQNTIGEYNQVSELNCQPLTSSDHAETSGPIVSSELNTSYFNSAPARYKRRNYRGRGDGRYRSFNTGRAEIEPGDQNRGPNVQNPRGAPREQTRKFESQNVQPNQSNQVAQTPELSSENQLESPCISKPAETLYRSRISTKQEIVDISSTIQSEIAEQQLKNNTFECMICCDTIHRSNPIWYCDNCFNIFHLKCAIEWCSIKSRNEAIANSQYPSLSDNVSNASSRSYPTNSNPQHHQEDRSYQRPGSIEWPCPTCREICHSKPNKYKCFCGKVIRPAINRRLTPHSCGQLCGRDRPNIGCPHTCDSLCHPGRCTPCSLTTTKTCFCGKLIREVKCTTSSSGCGQTCDKSLSCGLHSCAKKCHSGPCGNCEEIITTTCYCGGKQVDRSCYELSKTDNGSTKSFSCDKICGKQLDCGKHSCIERCHPGPNCSSCKLLSQNIKSCPCGSTLIKKSLLSDRKSCLEPVPTCENKCNRLLICGPNKNRHRCQKKCHTGSCPPCKLKTSAHCECKLSTKTVECALMYEKVSSGDRVQFTQLNYTFKCETRCNKLKNCGRHRCNNKCCDFLKNQDSSIHKCDQLCNKKLVCGQHNCQEPCHLGLCGDCANVGWEELSCHCGSTIMYPPIPCGSRAPTCHRLCRRTHSCGHPVKHECHDDTEKCAPCTVFVKKSCFCGSDSKDSVYCYLPGYSCGRTCKKQLACRKHFCKRVCHDNECETPDKRGAIPCTQPCPVARFSCKHPCGVMCHGTAPCPSTNCKKNIEITCECGNKVERVECYKVMKDLDNSNRMAMMSTSRLNQDSIIIDLTKKPPPKAGQGICGPMKRLDCDETCSTLKRNKALAEALDIVQPDLKPVSIFGEDPLRLLKEATAQDYKFVAATFNSLSKLIKSVKESEKRFIFMQFPPANKLRRELVHELAHHFNCTSESRDDEPFRHVVVRAYKNKSCVPDFNIEQLLPVSD